jgi:serine protease
MRRLHWATSSALSLALVLAGLALNLATSARAEILSDSAAKNKPVVGLVIKYKEGVLAKDFLGNQVALSPELKQGEDLGLGMYSANFEQQVDETVARKVADALTTDSRIETIYLNHYLTSANFHSVNPILGKLKASSAPTGLKAIDAWQESQPANARVLLSWNAPTNLNGGKLWGYRIWKFDHVANKFTVIVSNTFSTNRQLVISKNLVPGATVSFKVSAITRSSNLKYMAVSSPSVSSRVTASSTPQPPVLQSAGTITSAAPVVAWAIQDKVARGGLSVNYVATATASDSSSASCSSAGNSCVLSGLEATKEYTVQVSATNARGSAISAVVQQELDPMISLQWYLDSEYGVNATEAWKITKGSPSIVVAVVDTGITDHPDLDDNVVQGYDFISSSIQARDGNGRDADPSDPGDYQTNGQNSSWHGTHVAGIIAAESNSIGIVGIAPSVKIQPVRVLGPNGGTEADIAAGMNWAIGVKISGVITNATPAKVVNLSIGSSDFSTCYSDSPVQLAIDEAKRRDVTLVTAAGNDDQEATASFPGNCSGNITIGATGIKGDRSYFSNYSAYNYYYDVYIGVDISAPGGDDRAGIGAPAGGQIWSTLNDGTRSPGNPTYGKAEGTSMSSPIAAGVVALMYSIRPTLTDDQVWSILSKTAKPFAPTSECTDQLIETTLNNGTKVTTGLCGVGIIDAAAAVKAVQDLSK